MSIIDDVASHLPELPVELFELAGKLDFADTAPVITIRPHKLPAPKPPAAPVPLASKSQAYQRTYLAQYTYPLVVCVPFVDPVAVAALKIGTNRGHPLRGHERDVAAIAKHERFYKLTTLNGAKLNAIYGCSVKYGPWLAVVTEQESCNDGESSFWRFDGYYPEVHLEWYGAWNDIPSYPSLQVVMGDLALQSETFTCCGGFQWCPTTNSCIPIQVECRDPTQV